MDRTRSPFGDIRESSGEEKGSLFGVFPMARWFELMASHFEREVRHNIQFIVKVKSR